MKQLYPVQVFVSLMLCTLLCNHLFSQCKDGEVAKSVSYDTLFAGGGNDLYSFSFPQFDPTLGTLIKVDLETIITVKYNYQLENTDAIPILYRVRVNRTDDINCSALSAPLSKSQAKNLNTHLLSRLDAIPNFGSDFIAVGPVYAFNKTPINYSIQDQVAGFLGAGNVDFEYMSTTDSYPSGSSHYLYSTSATDSIAFKLTYYYCAVNFLPADIMNFTATPSSGQVQLAWYTPNDIAGETYEVQKSSDGKNFVGVKTIVSTRNTASNYKISYQPAEDDGNKLFFRIKQYGHGGAVKYTAVRIVVVNSKLIPSMKVYPTLITDHVRVYFANMPKDDWHIKIVSMTGMVLQQTSVAASNFIRIPVSRTLPAGVYVLQAENKRTHAMQMSRVCIQ